MISDLSCIVIIRGLPTPEAAKRKRLLKYIYEHIVKSLEKWQRQSIFRFRWTRMTFAAVSALFGSSLLAALKSASGNLMAILAYLVMNILLQCASTATSRTCVSCPLTIHHSHTRLLIAASTTSASTSLLLVALTTISSTDQDKHTSLQFQR